ncbi:hypothetical protein ABEY04_29060 [Bacillus mycoides]
MAIAMAVLKFVGGLLPFVQELLKAFMEVRYFAIIYKNYHTNDLYPKDELMCRSFV